MNSNKSFSLSLQKQIQNRKISLDTELNRSFDELKLRSLLKQGGIIKKKGFSAISLLFMIVLLPFIKRGMNCFWSSKCVPNQLKAKKDTYYRFLNNERFNWRKFILLLVGRIIACNDDVPLKQKTIIADDTIAHKTGKNMEFVSYHHDHTSGRTVLGYQYLQLGYHNGANFFPIDMAPHTSNKRPNCQVRDIDKRTNGWQRRKEALNKKTDVLIAMLDRAWKAGIDASFVLFDSWFACDKIISAALKIGYGVICRLKRNRTKYTYEGKEYTLKQLWKTVAKKKTKWIGQFQVKGVCLNVSLPKSGKVRILFISNGKKSWQAILSTDLTLDASEILDYYARRWAIEVFFKDAKQMLYLGKEQSNTFDAAIACYSIVMIRYLLVVYILNKNQISGPIGPLFREISDSSQTLFIAENLWAKVKEMLLSTQVFYEILEPDVCLYILDIVEDAFIGQLQISTAKL
jgi:hypothetical protein